MILIKEYYQDPETKEVEYDGLEIVGLSAQEVQKILPTAVTKQEDEEYWGLNYQDVFVLMVKAIQELSAKIDTLETENTALKARVTTLEG